MYFYKYIYNKKVVRHNKGEEFMTVHSYKTESGKDLIMEYIDSLSMEEQIDAFSVLQCMEDGEFDKLVSKRWQKTEKSNRETR